MQYRFTSIALIASVIAVASTQDTHGPGDKCSGSVSYCVSGSGGSPIILRCDGSKLYAGNCDDNLNEPPLGALCIESSPTAGDAQCSAIGTSSTTAVTASATSTASASTCSPFSAPAGACPTAANPCCAYICAEAQVPFGICQATDGTGEFATCTKCAGGSATATASSSSSCTTTTASSAAYVTSSSSAKTTTEIKTATTTTSCPSSLATSTVAGSSAAKSTVTAKPYTAANGTVTASPPVATGAANVMASCGLGMAVVAGFVGIMGML